LKTFALSTFVLASMATLALSQESRIGGPPGLLAPGEALRDSYADAASSDPLSNPFSFSPEALFLAESEPSFSIGPMVGYLHTRGADRGTWFGGVQARLHFARILAAEASISFHENRYEGGDVSVTQYPVQLTAFLYPFPDGPFRPYLLGGVGWYYTRIDYTGNLSSLSNETEHTFGEHLGLGVELMLGPRTSLDLDVRYIFLNPTNNQVTDLDFNYWQITLGLNFFF
jgi:opacity protein-like surface antigen